MADTQSFDGFRVEIDGGRERGDVVLDRPPLSREVFRRALLGINEAIILGVT